MADMRPPLGAALAAFGVAATVTPVGGAPVVTTVIDTGRPPAPAIGTLGLSGATVDLRRVVAIPRVAVPALPIGSTIVADLDGQGVRAWRVDRLDALREDEFRAVVS